MKRKTSLTTGIVLVDQERMRSNGLTSRFGVTEVGFKALVG